MYTYTTSLWDRFSFHCGITYYGPFDHHDMHIVTLLAANVCSCCTCIEYLTCIQVIDQLIAVMVSRRY